MKPAAAATVAAAASSASASVSGCRLARQARWLGRTITYEKFGGGEFVGDPRHEWEQGNVLINSRERGSTNDEGMEHFWASRLFERLPEDKRNLKIPNGRLSPQKWTRLYQEGVKEQWPMPVTQWVEEPGLADAGIESADRRDDAYLLFFRNLHYTTNQHYKPYEKTRGNTLGAVHHGAPRLRARSVILKEKHALFKRYSPVVACDDTLDWIKKCVGDKPIVEVQARLGYWSHQLQQYGISVAKAYDEYGDLLLRRNDGKYHFPVSEHTGATAFSDGIHDEHAVLSVTPDRYLDELAGWKGDTFIHIGQGAVGGGCDVGMFLMSRGENWELYDTRRILFWPLTFHYAYCFKKMTDEQVRERDVKGSPSTQANQADAAQSFSTSDDVRLTSYDPNEDDGDAPRSTRRPLRSYPCAATASQVLKEAEAAKAKADAAGKPAGESP